MIEAYGDIWEHVDDYDIVVITTNGYVKKNGEAVLGRGIALEAVKRFPGLPELLGLALKEKGNQVYMFSPWRAAPKGSPEQLRTFDVENYGRYITFPVKPEYGPNGEMGWKAQADPKLIEQSAHQMVALVNRLPYQKILMPRPGCGNGRLRWETVKPIIAPILDNRFTVMEKLA